MTKTNTRSRIVSILLVLMMLLSLLPTTALAASPDASNVYVDGGKNFYNSTRLYYKNGDPDGSFTGTSTEFNAAYEPSTGTLTLKDYNGKGITVGGVGRTDITVVLKGTNIINDGSLENAVGGDITVTSSDGGKLSITRTLSNDNPTIGIETGWATSYETGNVTITGDAKVTIDMTHNGTQGFDKAYGIFAKENITISESASVDITCATPNNTAVDASNCNGLRAGKDVIIDTSGMVKIDVTKAGKNDALSIGVYPSRNATLTRAGDMAVEWKKHGSNSSYSGGAIYGDVSFDTTTHAVNVDTNNCYASYRYGTPYYTATVKNGTLTGPGVKYANRSGNFLENDTVNIKPDTMTSESGGSIPFKEWTASGVTLAHPNTADTSFSVPANNVTVTATHSPFVGKPTFTRESEANGTIAFKTAVKPNGGTENFQYVEVGKEGDNYAYKSLSSQPTTASTASPYEYSVTASTSYTTVIQYLEAGDYRMAVTLNGKRYLSDPFTVNYTAPATTYTVSFDANGGTGTMADVTGVSGEYMLPANGFTAPAGKQFKAWSVGGSEKAVGDKITVTANTTVTAVWEAIEYNVTVTGGTASVGAGTPITKATMGTTVTLTAGAAPTGKVFDKWEVVSGGITLADVNSATTTFTMPAEAVSVKATYKTTPVTTYNLTTQVNGGHGTISASKTGLTAGSTETITFTPDAGYEIDTVTVNGTATSVSGNTLNVTMNENKTVVVTYKAIEYNITVTDGKATIGAGSEISKAAQGTTITLTANAAPSGKVFDKWEVVSGDITLADASSATTTFTMLAGAVSVKATYKDAPHTHTFDQEIVKPEALKSAADCTNDAVYFKSCSCGEISTTETFTAAGTQLGHAWASDWSKDTDNHWKECSRCHEKKDEAAHDYGSDNICDTCGYDKTVPHTHNLTLVPAKAPTCTENGNTAYYTCDGCDKWFEDATGASEITDKTSVILTATGHSASDWKSDNTDHWKECTVVGCGVIIEDSKAAHTAGEWIIDTPATATTSGSKHKECTVCGYTMATETIPATGGGEHTHSYGSEWKNDADNHWHECSCGDKADKAAHDFKWVIDKAATKEATGIKHEECTVCGAKRSENTVIDKLPDSGNTGNTGSGDNNTNKPGKDDSTKSPQTGDSSNLIGWLAALFVSGGAVTLLGVSGKKRKESEVE